MTASPSFEDIFAVMAAASVGDLTSRVPLPADPSVDDQATKFAIALNILLGDLQRRAADADRELAERQQLADRMRDLYAAERAARDAAEEATRELRRAQARFGRLADSGVIGIVVGNMDGSISYANDALLSMLGYGRDEVLTGRVAWRDLTPAEWRPVDARAVEQLHATGIGELREKEYIRKDGSRVPVLIGSAMLDTDTGDAISFVLDITERKEAQATIARIEAERATEASYRDRLEAAKDRAEAANRELEAFSYSVAHDLRAPLRGMSGFAHLLLEGHADKLDAEGRGFLGDIQRNARKMGELIDGLLSLARVTRSDLDVARVDLGKLAREEAAQLAASEPMRSVQLQVQPALEAEVDPRLARALFYNLLGNAWKFTRNAEEPRIEVGARDEGQARVFYVRDNGAGFDMAFSDKLFSPFQRLHTHDQFPGTGIGLATVQRIVQRHGGRIWAEAAVGGGATFYFTLPAPKRQSAIPR